MAIPFFHNFIAYFSNVYVYVKGGVSMIVMRQSFEWIKLVCCLYDPLKWNKWNERIDLRLWISVLYFMLPILLWEHISDLWYVVGFHGCLKTRGPRRVVNLGAELPLRTLFTVSLVCGFVGLLISFSIRWHFISKALLDSSDLHWLISRQWVEASFLKPHREACPILLRSH